MVTLNVERGEGKGTYKMAVGVASIANGGTITVDFNNIVSVALTPVAASGDYAIADVISISGNTVTVGLAGAASGTAPSSITSNTDVYYVIIGY